MKNKIKRLLKRIFLGLEASRRSTEMVGKGPAYGVRGNQRVKILVATAAIAATAATAQAQGLGVRDQPSSGGFWGPIWNWFRTNFGLEQFVESAGTIGQPTSQAYGNVAGSAFSTAPVPAPNGPQGGGRGDNPLATGKK